MPINHSETVDTHFIKMHAAGGIALEYVALLEIEMLHLHANLSRYILQLLKVQSYT